MHYTIVHNNVCITPKISFNVIKVPFDFVQCSYGSFIFIHDSYIHNQLYYVWHRLLAIYFHVLILLIKIELCMCVCVQD